MEKKYLTHEEQFKEVLNNEEIGRIENDELREMRSKYWDLRHKAFIDEKNITDSEFCKISDRLFDEERKELEVFRLRNNIK